MPAPKKPPVLSQREEEGPEPVSRDNAYLIGGKCLTCYTERSSVLPAQNRSRGRDEVGDDVDVPHWRLPRWVIRA